jgi:hypothetical protein
MRPWGKLNCFLHTGTGLREMKSGAAKSSLCFCLEGHSDDDTAVAVKVSLATDVVSELRRGIVDRSVGSIGKGNDFRKCICFEKWAVDRR